MSGSITAPAAHGAEGRGATAAATKRVVGGTIEGKVALGGESGAAGVGRVSVIEGRVVGGGGGRGPPGGHSGASVGLWITRAIVSSVSLQLCLWNLRKTLERENRDFFFGINPSERRVERTIESGVWGMMEGGR
eukprot:TRINITY_DN438_c0_g1_i4.p3 TRINITY_DN438_c0_g1~~TRINITY_DN438_c0_g1_i4.p3  ORF type:complete len:134 (+),score=30.53 TRINITY_DN438_c0_g1_i4:696-1097(+)